MFYTYILKCSDQTYYTGSTNNLNKRLKQHNELKSGARYTKMRRPTVLIYAEEFSTLSESRKRETEIKRLTRVKKTKLVLSKTNALHNTTI